MSELGQIFAAMDDARKLRRASNTEKSTQILKENNIAFRRLSPSHFRVGEYDFWPSTGLFIHIKNGVRSRGVFNLMNKIRGADGKKV